MKTLVATNTSFGPAEVLEFKELVCPDLGPKDFLLKAEFATVSTADIRLRSKNVPRGFKFIMGLLFGFRKPKYESLGTDYVGQVVQIGKSVQDVKLGDRVVVDLGMGLNGYRTYRRIQPKEVWAKLPEQVSSEDAVCSIFGGVTALLYLRDKLKIQSGDRILVIGAGGAVGSSAVQLAKYFGAEVLAVCSAGKADVVRGLGASVVLDYKSQDWEQQVQKVDVIIDCVGVLNIANARKLTKPGGRVGFVVADLPLNLNCVIASLFEKRTFVAGAIQVKRKDLQFLIELISKGLFKPLIGKRFPFEKIVDAHREVESGHRLGSTLLIF